MKWLSAPIISILICADIVLLVSAAQRKTAVAREKSEWSKPQPAAEESDWNKIQPLADDAVPEVVQSAPVTNAAAEVVKQKTSPASLKEKLQEYSQKLELMKTVERQDGETLLTGDKLIFDYELRNVRMVGNVLVEDDRGELETGTLIGRFSISNDVEYVEAIDGVTVYNEGRTARAKTAVYDYQDSYVQLGGHAVVTDGGRQLSGERIQLWLEGEREVICEPNALLVIPAYQRSPTNRVDTAGEVAEVRADRMHYAEKKALIKLDGNVRLRDPRASMDCEKVRLYLKDNDEIDWILAQSEVIIQTGDRKALSDKATYHASEGRFELEGSPKVKQGKNIMTGDRITFWEGSQRMVCEPNARLLLYPDEETKAKFLKDINK